MKLIPRAAAVAAAVLVIASGLPAAAQSPDAVLPSPETSPPTELPAPSGDWPQFRGDARHTGVNIGETELSAENVADLGVAWTATTGFNSSPAVADGVVYVGSGGGTLNAYPVDCGINAAECTPLWWGNAGGHVDWSSPAVSDGVVYIGSGFDLTAWAVGCGTGGAQCAPLWVGSGGNIGYSSPAVAEGVVAVGGTFGKLWVYAVGCATDGAACTPLWTADIPDEVHTSPAIADGVVYIGGHDFRVSAFDIACRTDGGTCTPLWTGATEAGIENSSPAVVDGVVYIGSTDRRLYAFAVGCATDGGTCTPLWRSKRTGAGITSSPAIVDGVVYVGSDDGRLYAYEVGCATDGGICPPLWRSTRTFGSIGSSPAVANGVVYVGSQGRDRLDGRLYAFGVGCATDGGTCPPLWRSQSTNALINASPAVANGRVYIPSNDGLLYAFALRSGDTTPPVTTAPVAAIRAGTTLGGGNTVVTWTSADDATDAVTHRLQQRDAGGKYVLVPLPRATATRVRLSLPLGVPAQFRVRAIDGVGNVSPWAEGPSFTPTLVDDTGPDVTYAGDGWSTEDSATASGGGVSFSTTAEESAELSFEGRSVAWIAPMGPSGGAAEILIDGVRVRAVDLHATGARPQQIVFRKAWPTVGLHTISVVVQATRDRPRVDVDAFLVYR